ncbi:hemolysin III family protein [Solirubrobacter ginsenosidimutans]|uniref:Hemolysin III family protein n=1 Tax=Solirubrobacter ginsenosidimutans TaxID=490573 RepID=A0A9X3N0I1_9ACTN|nr:hemolysin III family protein [Solirubrobacter ginsenosidimutans]MDA0165071.1 hemolysin III family protein [Solirubrobacter ginsenosidimutans]
MDAFEIPRLRGVTHAYAFWGALVAAAVLIVLTPGGMPRASAAIYGAGLCALFGGSALYHRWRWNPRWRPILRRIDHSTIFVFIAASYTPVGLLILSGTTKWVVMITVWAGALCGVALSVAWITAPRALCAACYVALGWVAVVAFPQMAASLPVAPLVLIIVGGVLYTAGAVIFALGRPNPWPRVFGFHEIFHVFVILAAVVHFVAISGWVVMHNA